MKINCRKNLLIPALVILSALLVSACATRSSVASGSIKMDEALSSAVESTEVPSATAEPIYSVQFTLNGEIIASAEHTSGQSVEAPDLSGRGLKCLFWVNDRNEELDPSDLPDGDLILSAVVCPILSDGPFLHADENGLLRPADHMTLAETREAVADLLGDSEADISVPEGEDDVPLSESALASLCSSLFGASECSDLPVSDDPVTRAVFASTIASFRPEETPDDVYFPDVSPAAEEYAALQCAGFPTGKTAEDYEGALKDGFYWINGYLYAWDTDNRCFAVNTTIDNLTFGPGGRYTCGNEELDGYVAQTIVEYTDPELDRLENLHKLYYHVKNDFQYLVRNYYESGATGWDIDEALTFVTTGKGNCYCYTGFFCALARGMGYNAVTWSGTMGTQNQPHAWTEITLDDVIYICDPEIELNYWLLEMYTDNFMMPKASAGGWNYQAVGRPA